jgi:CBS domain containing-hemolysin-like protein
MPRLLLRVRAPMPVTELLRWMRDERRHMVLVADEHGNTIGLITLEDLVEELVGESDDERRQGGAQAEDEGWHPFHSSRPGAIVASMSKEDP